MVQHMWISRRTLHSCLYDGGIFWSNTSEVNVDCCSLKICAFVWQVGKDIVKVLHDAITRQGLDMRVAALVLPPATQMQDIVGVTCMLMRCWLRGIVIWV